MMEIIVNKYTYSTREYILGTSGYCVLGGKFQKAYVFCTMCMQLLFISFQTFLFSCVPGNHGYAKDIL